MDARMRARRALEVELRRALVAGEFELNYQPFVSTTTNAVTGFEALLRWRNPVRGMVPPADFIPLAEEIGLITPIGEWVLRQACAEAANWPSNIRVAVNLSAVQFKGNKLAAVVASALAASGLPAERLELEITESVLLRNSEANLTTLHQLRALGVRISMDDFGTGYSSLSYLRSFPFDKIKIDQFRRCRHCECGHRARDQPRHFDHRRRRGNRRPAGAPQERRLHGSAGLLPWPPHACARRSSPARRAGERGVRRRKFPD
jgi:predicted signal transduction protein with EAL and GGDEF domain